MQTDAKEKRRLEALASYSVVDTPPEKDFDDIAHLAAEICGTPIAVVNLIGDKRQFFKAEVGLGVRETPFESSFCAKAILEDDFLMIPDATKDGRFDCNPLVVGEPHLRFYAGAILKTPDSLPIGTVCVLDYEPRALTELQQTTLRVLARQVMVQLELRRELKEKARQVEVQRRLGTRRLARAMASETVRDELRIEEERLKSAQAAGRVGTFELDVATNVMTVSEEFCRIFGVPVRKTYSAAEFEKLVVPDDQGIPSDAKSRSSGTALLDVDYRICRADDGALRWVSRRSRFAQNETGEIEKMFGVVFDTTDTKQRDARIAAMLQLGDRLRHAQTVEAVARTSAEIFSRGLEVARAGYSTVDQATDSFLVEFDWTAPGAMSIAGRHSLKAFSATIARLATGNTMAIPNVRAADWLSADAAGYSAIGTRSLVKVPILKDGDLVGVLFAHDDKPRTWTKGELDFAWGVADRTYAALAKIKAEDEQRLLNQELSHRMKNTLAMVQAIAGQTLKNVAERDAVEAFTGRLQALSSAHDVLLQQSWSAVQMRNVIEKVLALHVDSHRLIIEGPNLTLGPKAGLSLSLVLHELATNAIKYGAFSNETGTASVRWRIEDNNGTSMLRLTWQEQGGPAVVEPERKGFGTRLIRMGLAGTGAVEKRYDPSGFIAIFQAPVALMQQTEI